MSFKVASRQPHTSKPKTSSSSSSTYPYEDADDVLSRPPLAFKSSTMALAHFLASTGPEEFCRPVKSKTKQARILDKLRRRASQNKAEVWVKSRKQNVRDSGVYSEVISDMMLPSYEAKAHHTDLNLFPKPPSVMPPQPPPSPSSHQTLDTDRSRASYPAQTKEIEAYTSPSMTDRGCRSCPHCRQILPLDAAKGRRRRRSCPPALAGNGPPVDQQAFLRDKIARLEAQLAQERQSRKRLEEAMSGKPASVE